MPEEPGVPEERGPSRLRRVRPFGPDGPRDARAGSAAALAARLERWCTAGIELRGRGGCAASDGRERRHARRGHDRGCAALGLTLRGLERALRRWDDAGAGDLLLEALEEAVDEIEARVGWSAEHAREALAHALHRRITPAPRRSGP